jgi:hypothetical protein
MKSSQPASIDKRKLSIIFVSGLVTLLFALGCFASYQKLYDERQYQARAEAKRMLLAFEEHSVRLFDYADGYLRSIRAYLADRGNDDNLEGFVNAIKAPHAELFSGIVTIIDREGWVTYQSETSRTKLKAYGQVSGLDHFQHFLKQPGDSLFVGATRLGKITGKQQFRLGRPLLKDGVFDGLIVMTMLPEHMTDFYQNLSLGQNSTVMMMTLEPKLIASKPPAPV